MANSRLSAMHASLPITRRFRLSMETTSPPDALLTSRFATTAEDLEVVLNLRRAFFKDKPVSPDTSYKICWAQNPYTMKIVYYANEPVGYWSLIPTTKDAYKSFLAGESSHEEMLTRHCVAWSLSGRDEAYLYIVGAVVPLELEAANRPPDLFDNLIRGRVLIDWCAFIAALFEHMNIKGICGYPSREYGYELLQKFGFAKSAVLIGQDENQPIFSLDESQMSHFRKSLDRFSGSQARHAPVWQAEDKRKFFDIYRI